MNNDRKYFFPKINKFGAEFGHKLRLSYNVHRLIQIQIKVV